MLNHFHSSQIFFKTEQDIHKGYFSNQNNGSSLLSYQKTSRPSLPSVVLAFLASKFSSVQQECQRAGICSFIVQDSNSLLQSSYYLACNEKYYKTYRFLIKSIFNVNHSAYRVELCYTFINEKPTTN